MPTIHLIIVTLALCLVVSARHPNLKIFGGKIAEPSQFPFIVSIFWNSTQLKENLKTQSDELKVDIAATRSFRHNRTFGHIYHTVSAPQFSPPWPWDWYYGSAGSIINEKWILTTAVSSEYYHFEPKDVFVVSGTNQIYTGDGGITYAVSQIVVHPRFNISSPENNIALFKIEGSFDFSDLIQPVKLGEVFVNDSVVVAGWGFSESGIDGSLRYAELVTLSNEECNAKVEDGRLVRPGELCAFVDQGVCFSLGDSGAPLIFNGTVVGLASRSINMCVTPDIYTQVSFFNDWINEVIGKS